MRVECGEFLATQIINGFAITAFKDMQEGRPRYYAWVGIAEDHDRPGNCTSIYSTENAALMAAANRAAYYKALGKLGRARARVWEKDL